MKNEVEITNTIARFRNKLDGWRRLAFTIIPLALGLAWFSLSPQTRADCTDGCFASDNTALGDHAGADPKASNNTAVGSFCMPLLTVPPGSFNTAVGSLSFYNAENGNDNTVIGYSAMGTGNGGIVGRSADFNTAAGAYALFYDSVGMQNTAAGAYALYSNSLGDNNTATGFKAMYGDPVNLSNGTNNTATGYQALFSYTTGSYNTASGVGTLYSDTTGSDNTATGYSALYLNVSGNNNTASGYQALYKNTAGGSNTAIGVEALQNNTASNNTATGYQALYGDATTSTGGNNTANGYGALHSNSSGSSNTAAGYEALYFNKTGSFNTASGQGALYKDTTSYNTATGYQSLRNTTTGPGNTANGYQALYSNTTAGDSTATGYQSLYHNTGTANTAHGQSGLYNNTTGATNTALGSAALYENSTGSNNIAVGAGAGFSLTTGSNNIDLGNVGVGGESAAIRVGTVGTHANTYIAGIYGVTVAGGIGMIVDSNGHLGTSTSSARFKDNIQPMDKASEALLALKPVTFRYKKGLDPKGIPQFGLVAEQVETVDPDLVARDEQGKSYSVRYEAVNAMLLNEFLKEHRTVAEEANKNREQEATIRELKSAVAEQQKEIKALSANLQRVSNQVELAKFATGRIRRGGPAPRVVMNNP